MRDVLAAELPVDEREEDLLVTVRETADAQCSQGAFRCGPQCRAGGFVVEGRVLRCAGGDMVEEFVPHVVQLLWKCR
ncbi:hypothetical protein [Streptomyces sp. I8-5]|uniref:hypothetical protein n=1 Tax=Streptomyces sp. I8-5 TaxID=3104277 RepID=UPI003866BC4E